FQIKDVVKGPRKGEFRSWGEQRRALEAGQIIDKAIADNKARAYVKTAELGQVKPQDENVDGFVKQAVEMFEGKVVSPETLKLSESELLDAVTLARRGPATKTLFGKPVEAAGSEPVLQEQRQRKDVKLLTFPE